MSLEVEIPHSNLGTSRGRVTHSESISPRGLLVHLRVLIALHILY